MNRIPTRGELLNPTLQALLDLGGSGSIEEINQRVIENLNISEDLANKPHNENSEKETRTELEYELAWARTVLKKQDLIKNSSRGIWALVDQDFKFFEAPELTSKNFKLSNVEKEAIEENWKNVLINILLDKLSPAAFERLIKRVLRETGFVQVEVTGRTNDGGIDGKGTAKINGILSFHVVFQCKRYKGAVSAPQIRDFRGAMAGRTDKGLFITTGYFTREAIKEASREGTSAIDLVDGEKLAEKLKELSLGVKVEQIERVIIEPDWFDTI
jgi:restriction system protein